MSNLLKTSPLQAKNRDQVMRRPRITRRHKVIDTGLFNSISDQPVLSTDIRPTKPVLLQDTIAWWDLPWGNFMKELIFLIYGTDSIVLDHADKKKEFYRLFKSSVHSIRKDYKQGIQTEAWTQQVA